MNVMPGTYTGTIAADIFMIGIGITTTKKNAMTKTAMTIIVARPTPTTQQLANVNTRRSHHQIAMITIVAPPTATTQPLAPANTYLYRRLTAMIAYVARLIRTIQPLANANTHPYRHPIATTTIVTPPMCITLLLAPASITQ